MSLLLSESNRTHEMKTGTDGYPHPHPLTPYPILGVCGYSGAGKTTLIEAVIPRLRSLGLQVAVVKDGAHKVQVDAPGKDSDRFFSAGADVALLGDQHFIRHHQQRDLTAFLTTLCSSYDIVLVEGHAATNIPKIWLSGSKGQSNVPPENQGQIIATLSREQATVDQLFSQIQTLLATSWQQTPIWGCILIGGKSSRMGRPKHLICKNNKTWLEHAVETLAPKVDQVVLSGSGEIPDTLSSLPRIPDAPGLAGPLAGILSVMRWQRSVSWLVMACDQPDVQPESLDWLLAQRRPGIRAVLPDLLGDGHLEPLLAWYDFRCRPQLEQIAASGSLRVSRLAHQVGVCHFQPPEHLHGSWRNVNTPNQVTPKDKRACRELENPC
ncbi:MAG: molybdopterin-guanine dinucleotide biosynthesis protein B [Candidatus Electrothrix sp. ATG1]|nr:molybdopterin-guanine dinucleotide biosynthesis protein B [Candidatus Electrothrix sp. ATG1]